MKKSPRKISKKTKISGLALLAFVSGVAGIYLLNRDDGDVLSWMDSNWLYRRSIEVNNSQGSPLTNEDVLIEVDTASLISAGKLQNDCDDLRFLDTDDSTSLSYWVEGGCNTANTQVWVQIPGLASGGTTIYMYYGNASAPNSEAAWSGEFILPSTSLSCPTGWSRFTALDSKFPYGSATAGTTGGGGTHNHGQTTCTSDTNHDTGKAQITTPSNYEISNTHTHANLRVDIDDVSEQLPPYQTAYFCSNSDLEANSSLPLFFDTSPTANWTQFNTWNTYFLYGGTTSDTGGSETHTHTTTGGYTTDTAVGTTWQRKEHTSIQQGSHYNHHHTTLSGTTGNGSNLPEYLEIPLYTTSQSHITEDPIVMSTESPPLGWERVTNLDNKYVRIGSSYNGTTQGSNTHSHPVTITTGTTSRKSYVDLQASGSASGFQHYHSCTTTTANSSYLPPYYSVIYSKRKASETITVNNEETEDTVRGWSKGDYSYHTDITVNNSQGSTLTDEHVLIELNTSNMITSGRLQADCDDLRFLDPANSSESLDYWIEGGCNTANTQVWVKIPSLPTEGKTIEMYYGNPAATSGELSWSGDVYIYSEQACPSGWTRVTAADDRFLYGSSTAGQTGGSATHTHTDISCTSDTISTTNIAGLSSGSNSGSTAIHAHDNLQASFDTVSSLPPYSTMVLCSKPSFTLPANAVSIFNSLPVTNWTRYTNLDDAFPMGKDTAGTTGGSSTHTHTLTTGLTTGTASASESNGQVTSSGGTVTYDGNYKIHTFTSNGTFTINAGVTAEYLIVGGGGAGGTDVAGGGGAGGVIHKTGQSISANSYPIVVGAGGATYATGGINDQGNPGGNSSFNGDIATGGGKSSGPGGSGGGGDGVYGGGSGTAGQGYNGGNGISGGSSTYWVGGGGGGAGAAGVAASYSSGGHGGAGYTSTISGSSYIYAGGGGGGYLKNSGGAGTGQTGLGGSGVGGNGGVSSGGTAIVGATSPTTYGSGGGGGAWQVGGNAGATAGYQGVVIIKFPNTSESGTMASDTHTHTTTSGTNSTESNIPPYMDVIFGESTTEAYIPDNIIVPVTELPPLGWDRVTTMDDKFTKGSTSYGATGGSPTHTHDVTIETGTPSATLSAYGSGVNFADSTHTHSCSDETASAESNLPPYLSVIYAERKTSESTSLDINTPPSKPTSLQRSGISPNYSAIFTDLDPSDTGNAYQIQVNTESDFTGTVIWDSTKTSFGTPIVNGGRTPDIPHAGTPLDISTMYHWRIKFWDDGDEEGEWSDPQTFSMSDSPVPPTGLLTDGQINPTLLDDPYPHFSAIYEDTNSQDSLAYEIEINTQSDFLGTVMWDSEKQPITISHGNRSSNIQYGGTPLSNTENTLYWRIKFWDLDDNPSEWSETATFIDYYPSLMFEGMSLEGISLN